VRPFLNKVKEIRKRVTTTLSSHPTVLEAHRRVFPTVSSPPKWTELHLLIFDPGASPQLPHADDWLGRAMVVNCYLQDGVDATEVVPGFPNKKAFQRCQLHAYKQLLRSPDSMRFESTLVDVKAGDGIVMPATQVHRGPGNCSPDKQRIILFCADSPLPSAQAYNAKFQLHALLLAHLTGKCVHSIPAPEGNVARGGNSLRCAILASKKLEEQQKLKKEEEEELSTKQRALMRKVKRRYARHGFSLEEHEVGNGDGRVITVNGWALSPHAKRPILSSIMNTTVFLFDVDKKLVIKGVVVSRNENTGRGKARKDTNWDVAFKGLDGCWPYDFGDLFLDRCECEKAYSQFLKG